MSPTQKTQAEPTTTAPRSPAPRASVEPHSPVYPAPVGARSPGIAIRDWLAAYALQGLIAHGMKVTADRALTEDEKDDDLAKRAYKLADAMLRNRSQTAP